VYKVGSVRDCLEINPVCVRQALNDWESLKMLGENPAAKTELIFHRQQRCGYSDTVVGRGLALREVMQEAVLGLKPAQTAPEANDKRWRPFLIISEQYLNGRSPDWLREQLHISRATYYLEQQRALQELTDILQGWQEKAFAESAAARLEQQMPPAGARKVFLVPPRAAHPLFGRTGLLEELKHGFSENGRPGCIALFGLPGTGKTSLAMELSYDPQIREAFEDGVLWAGLGQQPDLLSIMGFWASELGLSSEIVASRSTLEERSHLIRSTIGLRQFLIVVDDAWQLDQALAFKLGCPNCSYLLTTRHADLAVGFAGAARVYRLGELSDEDGMALLSWFAPAATDVDSAAAAELVSSVGALPLALVLMGSYLQVQSATEQPRRIKEALAFLKHQNALFELQVTQSPLETRPGLPAGTPVSLQAVIGLSEGELKQTAQKALANLSLFPSKPNSFSEKAALAVCACSTAELDALVDSGLLEPVQGDRYCMHQVISDYASLKFCDPESVERMVSYYHNWLVDTPHDPAQITMNIPNIVAACQQTFLYEVDRSAIRLVNEVFNCLEIRGLYDLATTLLEQALEAAGNLAEPALQAELLLKIGDIAVRRGKFEAATNYLNQSVLLARGNDLLEIEASVLFNLGMARLYAGEISGGLNALNQALEIARHLENPEMLCYSLNGLGFSFQEVGEFRKADKYLEEAVCLARECGSERGLGWAHQNLSMVKIQKGEYVLAHQDSRKCTQVYQSIGDSRGAAWQMYHEARIDRQRGDYESAALRFETALNQLDKLGDWMGKGFCLHNLGLLKAELGNWHAAWFDYQNARYIFESINCRAGLAQCLHSIGLLHRKSGAPQAAIPLLEDALELREQISFRRGVGMSTAAHAISLFESGLISEAVEEIQRAVDLFRRLETPASLAYSLTFLGRMQMERENFVEAFTAFDEALRLRTQLKQTHLYLEPQVGLAYSAQKSGQGSLASQLAKEVWNHLRQTQSEAGVQVVDQLAWVYLYLGNTLIAQRNIQRACTIWQWGAIKIHEQVHCLPPEATLTGFIRQIPANRELLALASQRFQVGGQNI